LSEEALSVAESQRAGSKGDADLLRIHIAVAPRGSFSWFAMVVCRFPYIIQMDWRDDDYQ
jgi:hypothetical protein